MRAVVYDRGIEQEMEMTTEDKKAKILAAISIRGWWNNEIYFNEGKQLQAEGKVKAGECYAAAGGRKFFVWEAA